MKFFKNKLLHKNNFYSESHLKLSKWSFLYIALLICCNTILNAQLLTSPTLQQQGTLVSPHTLQNGGINNLVSDPSFNKEVASCGIEEGIRELTLEEPNFKESSQKGLRKLISEVDSVINRQRRSSKAPEDVMIPVIFHYFYDECALGHSAYESGPPPIYNYERFENAIRILNEDFNSHTAISSPEYSNFDHSSDPDYSPQVASKISFRLAEIDPEGNPTNGVNYIKSGLTNEGAGNGTKLRRASQWPRDTYLNVYIVEKATPNLNSGIAHYPESSDRNSKIDGAVVARWAFDPTYTGSGSVGLPVRNNYRATLSHEVGHWLGLRHVWGGSDDSNCSIDDFDFYSSSTAYNPTDENAPQEFTDSVTDFNDTPKCKKPSDDWRICNNDDGCGEYAHDYNIMDYSSCRLLFTRGQKRFMEAVMSSSLSDRNKIKGNNPNAFHINYSNYDAPISTPSVVFTNGSIAYESKLNDGSILNSFVIELRGGKVENGGNFTPLQFNSQVIGNGDLLPNEFSFQLPSGFTASIEIIDPTTAELIIDQDDVNVNHSTDQEVTIEFDQSIFNNVTVSQLMRSKIIKFDFLDDIEYKQYSNTLHYNMAVGPQSSLYKGIKIAAPYTIGDAYIGSYEGMYGLGRYGFVDTESNMEYIVDSNGFIKTFSNGESIQDQNGTNNVYLDSDFGLNAAHASYLFSVGPELHFRKINLPADDIFYVAVKIHYCEDFLDPITGNSLTGAYMGWIRLKKDNECERLIVLDSGVKTNGGNFEAGDQGKPSILYHYPVITKIDNLGSSTYKGFNIEIRPSNTSLKFANQIQSTDYYINITDIKDPHLYDIQPNDLKITRIDDYNLTVEPADSDDSEFWTDPDYIYFTLNFKDQAFVAPTSLLSDTEFEKFKSTIVDTDMKDDTFISGVTEGQTLMPDSRASLNLGPNRFLVRYENDLGEGGYALGSIARDKIEAACIPNHDGSISNEIELFDYGHSSSNLYFKEVNEGHQEDSTDDTVTPYDLFISDARINSIPIGESKYIIYRRVDNCETYYTWIEISFNADKSLNFLGWGDNFIEGEHIFAGVAYDNEVNYNLENGGSGGCTAITSDLRDFIHIKKIVLDYGQPGQTEFSGPVDFEPNRYSDFTATPIFNFDLSNKYTYNFLLDFGGDWVGPDPNVAGDVSTYTSIWIDFNKNDSFESDEHILQLQNGSNNNDLSSNICFPNDMGLTGLYKMRIITNIHKLPGAELFNNCSGIVDADTDIGCGEIVGGEIEDYSFTISSDCDPPLDYHNVFSIPSETVLAESIILSSDYLSGSTINIMPHTRATMRGASVCILPATEIHYGSVFLAEAVTCGEPGLKLSKPEIHQSTVKVHPNPFNQQCNIEYTLYEGFKVSLFVSDITGKEVASLIKGEKQYAGSHQVTFNAKGLSPGIYYCTLINGDKIETQKMVITN